MPHLYNRQKEIIERIRTTSPFDTLETNRIIGKYFASVPRLVKICDKYGFGEKKVLDIGAAYGQTLYYWGPESEGVDVSEKMLRMPNAYGRKTYIVNVEDGFTGVPKNSYDAIYTNNLLEHLVAPHLFLVRLHGLLKSKGLLAIGHPLVPPFPFSTLWKIAGFEGWLEQEHVNFFTPKTARLTLERSGFRVIHQYFSLFRNPIISKFAVPFGVHCISICEKVDNYRYEPVRHPMFDPSWAQELSEFHALEK